MKTVATVSPRTIAGMLKMTAKQDVRYYLNGVFFETDTGTLVATDGHALMAHRTDARLPDVKPFIIPGELLASVAKAKCMSVRVSIAEDANEGERTITLEQGMGFAADFCPTGATFTAREVAGRFPDWHRVVPTTPDGTPSQFNPEILSRVQEAMADVCDAKKRRNGFGVTVHHNGPSGGALVTCEQTNVIAVIMPWRMDHEAGPTLDAMGLRATAAPAPEVPEAEVQEALAA